MRIDVTNLSKIIRGSVILDNILIEYKKQEKLIILTSHNKEDIESLCDHTYQIQSGQIIAE